MFLNSYSNKALRSRCTVLTVEESTPTECVRCNLSVQLDLLLRIYTIILGFTSGPHRSRTVTALRGGRCRPSRRRGHHAADRSDAKWQVGNYRHADGRRCASARGLLSPFSPSAL